MRFFDTHCHLDHPLLIRDLRKVLGEAEKAGIGAFMVPGVLPQDWKKILSLSRQYPNVFPAFGLHPAHAHLWNSRIREKLEHFLPWAKAVGEIGLDYAIGSPSRPVQQQAFRSQLELAVRSGLPVLIHCRKAFPDLLAILGEEGMQATGGVMHAFSGSVETAAQCLKLGLHISISGSVTYENAVRPVAVAVATPWDRLLLETDSPDLSPVPHRGEVNLPAYLLNTASRVAALRGVTLPDLAEITTRNACRLFGIAC